MVWGDVQGIDLIMEVKRDPVPVVSVVPKLTPLVGVSGMSELEASRSDLG